MKVESLAIFARMFKHLPSKIIIEELSSHAALENMVRSHEISGDRDVP